MPLCVCVCVDCMVYTHRKKQAVQMKIKRKSPTFLTNTRSHSFSSRLSVSHSDVFDSIQFVLCWSLLFWQLILFAVAVFFSSILFWPPFFLQMALKSSKIDSNESHHTVNRSKTKSSHWLNPIETILAVKLSACWVRSVCMFIFSHLLRFWYSLFLNSFWSLSKLFNSPI